jgi:hypothetical protein
MSRPGGYVESHRVVRSPEALAELVLEGDREKFEQAVLELWCAHVRRVYTGAGAAWRDMETSAAQKHDSVSARVS